MTSGGGGHHCAAVEDSRGVVWLRGNYFLVCLCEVVVGWVCVGFLVRVVVLGRRCGWVYLWDQEVLFPQRIRSEVVVCEGSAGSDFGVRSVWEVGWVFEPAPPRQGSSGGGISSSRTICGRIGRLPCCGGLGCCISSSSAAVLEWRRTLLSPSVLIWREHLFLLTLIKADSFTFTLNNGKRT